MPMGDRHIRLKGFLPLSLALTSLFTSLAVSAQGIPSPGPSPDRGRGVGWEFGGDLFYQDGTNVGFGDHTSAELDDEPGIGFHLAYRFNEQVEVRFGVDWQEIDYQLDTLRQGDPELPLRVRGELEVVTPRLGLVYNFLPGPITPWVGAGIGWSFVDTNIPEGPPLSTCWWDPWWGYVCGRFRDTRTFSDFAWHLGAGFRWDFAQGFSLRAGYEKHWLDVKNADGTPDFDQFRLGVVFWYR